MIMKRKLQFVLVLVIAFAFTKTNAQSFDYNITAADPALGAFTPVTQGAITLSATALISIDGSYKILNLNADGLEVVLTSSADIRQAIYFLRGAGGSATATPVVTYGTSSSDPSMTTAPAQTATASAPGIPIQYDFPAGTRYVRMVRTATVRMYRVTAGSSAYTLPLDFLSFTAKTDALNKFVNLNWSTTNEVNTKNFEIQKRTDISDFKTIGTVNSKNVSGIHNYSFVDGNLINGTSYYRLNQIDNDGNSKFSEIATANIKSAISLSVYPNPVVNSLNVSHPAASNQANIKIFNLEGKTILQKSLLASATSTQLDVSDLTTGSYLIVIEDQSEKSSIKFIKK
jgi:hypothetical protein